MERFFNLKLPRSVNVPTIWVVKKKKKKKKIKINLVIIL